MAVDDADVAAAAEVLRRVHAEAEQPVVRHGGIFGMDVGLRRAVVTDGAAAEDQIAQPDALLQAPREPMRMAASTPMLCSSSTQMPADEPPMPVETARIGTPR